MASRRKSRHGHGRNPILISDKAANAAIQSEIYVLKRTIGGLKKKIKEAREFNERLKNARS